MKLDNRLLGSIYFIVLLSGCDRATSTRTEITVQVPSVAQLQKSVSAFSAISTADIPKLCFGVNVKNVSTPRPPAKACDIDRGLVAGTVGPGESLVIAELETAALYDFDLYVFKKDSATQTCPSFASTGWNWPVEKIYYVGGAKKMEVKPPVAQIDIEFRLADVSQNIATQNAWPASCRSKEAARKFLGQVSTSAKVLSSTNYRLYSKVSSFNDQKGLGGSSYKIRRGKVSP